MKIKILKKLTLAITMLLATSVGFSQSAMGEPLAGVDNTEQYSTMDMIYMDKELSIFANLLNLAGLDTSLRMMDQKHTLFVPTNEAFADMSVERFAELTNPENRALLVAFVKRHFIGSELESSRLNDHDYIDLGDDKRVTIASSGNRYVVGDATVIAADVMTSNGIVHVVNDFIKLAD